jgi:hypothetical protein
MQRFFSDEAAEPSLAMADYYSILAKAVNALDPNTGMARQQLYQRARSAMISELENVYPPFRRSEITTARDSSGERDREGGGRGDAPQLDPNRQQRPSPSNAGSPPTSK